MRNLLNKLRKRLANEKTVGYLRLMAIPFVVAILIFAVVMTDEPDKRNEIEPSDVSQEETDTVESTDEDIKGISLQREETGSEIYNLMAAYFQARETCDVNGLAKVFGNSVSDQDMEEESRRMEEEVKYCKEYVNLDCYSAKGPEEGSQVVYSCFSIRLRQSDTLAPSMFSCYVKRGEDGSWHIAASPSQEEAAYMEKLKGSDAVRAMADRVDAQFNSALAGDSSLASVYRALTGDGDGR